MIRSKTIRFNIRPDTLLMRMPGDKGKPSYWAIICLFVLACICSAPLYGQAADPGWKMIKAAPVSPDEARRILERKVTTAFPSPSAAQDEPFEMATMGAGPSTSETEITPEIEELARALQHDPKLIFDYVSNHIVYVPTYGSVNGATATLLAGRGNDWDQASLFIALMRASGYTANYVHGDVSYSTSLLAHWLGVDSDKSLVVNIFANGGIPVWPYSDDYVKLL